MNQSRMSSVRPRSSQERSLSTDQVGELFAALEDEDCRTLLQAAAGEPLSASEFSDRCDLPLSTTYRKVDILADVGLFEERLRLSRSGKHTSEYALCIEEIHLSLADDGIELSIPEPADNEEPAVEAFAGAD